MITLQKPPAGGFFSCNTADCAWHVRAPGDPQTARWSNGMAAGKQDRIGGYCGVTPQVRQTSPACSTVA